MGKEIYRGEFHANEKHGHGSIMWLKNEDDESDYDECRSQHEDENLYQVKDGIFATQHSEDNLLSLLTKNLMKLNEISMTVKMTLATNFPNIVFLL